MRRRVFSLLSALSLLACAGTCVLWARGHWVEDALVIQTCQWSRSGPRVMRVTRTHRLSSRRGDLLQETSGIDRQFSENETLELRLMRRLPADTRYRMEHESLRDHRPDAGSDAAFRWCGFAFDRRYVKLRY